jgi:hypothetical protein
MHNDRLQGILFNQTELLDLVQRTPKQRFMNKLRTTRQTLRSWRLQPTRRSTDTSTSAMRSEYYVIPIGLSKYQYDTQMSELIDRLKVR